MAKISTYPILSTPTLNDLLIGTDVENLNITKNFSIGDIASFIVGGSYVPYVGATGNVNLGAFNITSSSFIVGGGLATQFLKANGTLDSTVYQPAGNYITQLSGEATASGPGNATVTLSNSAVINKVLTGLTITGNAIVATDSILTAFGKVQNQINTLVGGVQYKGTWNAATNVPALVSSVGISGNYYVVSVAGNTNLNGITDWNLGDWAIFNGSAWEKVDNTDAVISVNGQVGAVVLTTTNISEGTNLYFTNSRARTAINLTTTGNSGAATYNNTNGFFNIPEYTLSGLGGVPLTRQLTINGTAFDLSANRSWSVGTVTSIATTGPLTGGTITGSGTIGITQAGASSDGYLSSTDWNTFNNKQNALTNPITGTGTIFTLPMWGGATSLIDSPLSYGSNNFNFQYNSATGGTVTFTNSGLTAYAYTIQMNNFGSPRSTVHSYTDGVVIQSIAGTQVSRLFANGNLILGTGTADNGHKLEIIGSLYVNTITNATVDTDRFIVSDGGVIKYRTGTELRSDIGAGIGSVTSVGLSMPSAFSVANSPITGAGTIAVTGAGSASQYVRGDGTLADFPTNTGGGSSVSYYLNGSVSQGTIGGVAYRELSKIPIFGAGTDISIAADGYIASFITDAGDPALLNIPAGNWNFETYFSASSGGGTPSFYVELYRYDGAIFTLIASSVGTPELISFGTNIQPYFSTLAVPQTALALTDRLAIRYYVIHDGRTITLHTEDNHLCQVVTTFSNGLTALNGLTAQVQYFQVGTSGTDFAISSATNIHTFNIPTASATNRGALSSADWTTFNNKQNALTNPITGTGVSGQVAYWNGTNSQTGSNNLFWDNTNIKLGIGTNTPEGTGLTVAGGGVLISLDSGAARKVLELYATSTGAKVSSTYVGASSYGSLELLTSNVPRLTIADTGGVTLTGALNGTSASFSGLLTAIPTATTLVRAATFGNTSTNALSAASIGFNLGGGDFGAIEVGYNSNSPYMDLKVGASLTQSLRLASTGAATFSSSVNLGTNANGADTALLNIKQAGTSYNNGIYIERGGERNGYHMYIGGALDSLTFRRNYFGTQSDVMSLTRDGNVGIGTASPDVTGFGWRTLTIKGGNNSGDAGVLELQSPTTTGAANLGIIAFLDGSNRNAQIAGQRDGATNSGALSFTTWNAGTGSERMRITSAGNIGIGTTSPQAKLEVKQTASEIPFIIDSSSDSNAAYTLYQVNGSGGWETGMSNAADGYKYLFSYGAFGTANSKVAITNTGNVGIGTASPSGSYSLTLAGNASSTTGGINLRQNTTDTLYIGNPSVANTTDIEIWNPRDGYLRFATNNTERMRITSGGDVVTFGAFRAYNTFFGISNSTGSTPYGFFGRRGSATGSGNDMTIFAESGLGIYTYTNGGVSPAGPFVASGGTSWTNGSSDIRKKKNFETTQGLAEILQIEPIKYHFNEDEDDSKKRLGFKAQNLLDIIPEMVSETGELAEDGTSYLTITPDYILPILVKAIQELKTEIDSLKNQIK